LFLFFCAFRKREEKLAANATSELPKDPVGRNGRSVGDRWRADWRDDVISRRWRSKAKGSLRSDYGRARKRDKNRRGKRCTVVGFAVHSRGGRRQRSSRQCGQQPAIRSPSPSPSPAGDAQRELSGHAATFPTQPVGRVHRHGNDVVGRPRTMAARHRTHAVHHVGIAPVWRRNAAAFPGPRKGRLARVQARVSRNFQVGVRVPVIN